MARPEVPDTGVLIQIIREGKRPASFLASLALGRIWMSTVVLAELYAGTRSPDEGRWLDRLVQASRRVDRVLLPSAHEWTVAGQLLARAIRLHGALRPRDHLADVLIVASAARVRGTVVTSNMRHMERWARLGAASGLDVQIAEFTE